MSARINEELAPTYEQLKAERDALAERVERLSGMLTESRHATKAAGERSDALAVENAALKIAMHPELIPDEVLDVFSDTAKYDHDSCDAWSGSWIKNTDEVIRAVMGAMAKPETPATDAALVAIEARGAVAAIESLISRKELSLTEMHPDTHAYGATQETVRNQIYDLELFAAELREAK